MISYILFIALRCSLFTNHPSAYSLPHLTSLSRCQLEWNECATRMHATSNITLPTISSINVTQLPTFMDLLLTTAILRLVQ